AITLTNTGNATLSITSVAVSGTNAGNFTQTNNCGSSIAADDICTINVTFKPSASGTRTAALSIADNASGSPQTVSLSGTGTSSAAAPAAAVSLSPTSLAFGNQLIQTSAARAITLTNTGNTTLSITSLAVSGTNAGNFTQTNNCGSSVAADAGCTITITFKPSASGARTATLNIADNVTGSPQTVSLSGTGTSTGALAAVAATVSLSSTSLAFGSEPLQMTSAAQTVTLTNSGTATLIVSSIAFTGTNTTDFTEANTCSTSVAAGGNCTIAILFTPAAIGTRTASLSITDNATGSPQPVSLSGTGIHAVVLSWTVSPTAEVTGYNVYRGTTSGGESSTPLNSTPLSGTTYTDESVTSGATYYYFVTAVVSNQDTPSAASNEAVATIPSP
ncbi:MAG: choice-of-anchor D domain-containing protein, partial [Terriglobia bacterium]